MVCVRDELCYEYILAWVKELEEMGGGVGGALEAHVFQNFTLGG